VVSIYSKGAILTGVQSTKGKQILCKHYDRGIDISTYM